MIAVAGSDTKLKKKRQTETCLKTDQFQYAVMRIMQWYTCNHNENSFVLVETNKS